MRRAKSRRVTKADVNEIARFLAFLYEADAHGRDVAITKNLEYCGIEPNQFPEAAAEIKRIAR